MMGVSLAGFIVTLPVSALLKPTGNHPHTAAWLLASGCVRGPGSTHTRCGLVVGSRSAGEAVAEDCRVATWYRGHVRWVDRRIRYERAEGVVPGP